MHLLGARRAIVPYQGSKWRVRRQLTARAQALGFVGAPSHVMLADPGPWGSTMGVVLDPADRTELVTLLDGWTALDPRNLFDRLQGSPVPNDPIRYAAEHLFLQRLAFSGKAVGEWDGCWSSPGFNPTSAYGTPATESFGAVRPMLRSLVDVLRGYSLVRPERWITIRGRSLTANGVGPTLVYLDPPYAGTTDYPNGSMSEAQVVRLADWYVGNGAAVMVSEQRGLPMIGEGWERDRVWTGRDDGSPFRGQQEEWLTWCPARG
jgi:hypothetical protein